MGNGSKQRPINLQWAAVLSPSHNNGQPGSKQRAINLQWAAVLSPSHNNWQWVQTSGVIALSHKLNNGQRCYRPLTIMGNGSKHRPINLQWAAVLSPSHNNGQPGSKQRAMNLQWAAVLSASHNNGQRVQTTSHKLTMGSGVIALSQ